MKNFRRFSLSLVLLFAFQSIFASSFVIRRVEIQGLQNLLSSTVRHYIPYHEGQTFSAEQSDQLLEILYKTGFFSNVRIARRGGVLIVDVKERPMITLVEVNGNKEIKTNQLKPILKKMGIAPGDVYNPLKLSQIRGGLQEQYGRLGYDATTVTTTLKHLSHNRIAIYINVDEGAVVKVNAIHFVGNHAFSEGALRNQMKLTTPGIFTIFNHHDRYSKAKLDTDIDALNTFYANHGYLRFRVVSRQVTYTPDHKRVNILLTVSEGPIYHLSGFTITGDTLTYKHTLESRITMKKGDVFSRAVVNGTNQGIGHFYANKGYAFATVNVVPSINEANHTVFVTFHVTTGQKVYVRRIDFTGNGSTDERVLRRAMYQMEAAPYSLGNINQSKRQILMMPYFKDVKVSTTPVSGTRDQVDVHYAVKEAPAGKASLQGGYSTASGFLYGASIVQPNFLGTGKLVSVGFQNSQLTQNYHLSYVNPFYTVDGVSRGFSLYYSRTKFGNRFNYQPYVMDTLGFDVNYGFHLSVNNGLGVDIGYQNIQLKVLQDNWGILAPSVRDFLCRDLTGVNPGTCNLNSPTNPGKNIEDSYNVFKLTGRWVYNGLDRAYMPTRGVSNELAGTIGAPVLSSSIPYYQLSDAFRAFMPLGHGFVINLLANIAYGNGYGKLNRLPFFLNYYAGGIGTVPGFQNNSLGPINSRSDNSALGGNLLTTAGVHLILPSLLSHSFRLALTVDAGNVFEQPRFDPDNPSNGVLNNDPFSFSNMRASAGLLITWFSPFGPINLSIAKPIVKHRFDQTQLLDFSMGANI
jgi:outer membrane protein insertion porin family